MPSKASLMTLMRPALNAKVAQPKITPIETPGKKPHQTMIAAIASRTDIRAAASWRAVLTSQRLTES